MHRDATMSARQLHGTSQKLDAMDQEQRKRVKFSSNVESQDEKQLSSYDEDERMDYEACVEASTDTSDDKGLQEKLIDFCTEQEITNGREFLRVVEGHVKDSDFQNHNLDVEVAILRSGLRREVQIELPSTVVKEALRRVEGEMLGYTRRARITDGLNVKLAHTFDLDAFIQRVNKLFDWHTDENKRKEFRAPCFPVVQSSGMGKTKLFDEARTRFNREDGTVCFTILCVDAELEEGKRYRYFDEKLLLESSDGRATWSELDSILEKCKKKIMQRSKQRAEKVVLLFDEAHGLMHDEEGLVFRAIRWWLRRERGEDDPHVVAVFAGTNPKLAGFLPVDHPPLFLSRMVKYRNHDRQSKRDKKQYPPFFQLHTIGCLHRMPSNATTLADPGFPHAALYGRPLFAYYYLEGSLEEAEKMADFAKRLVLSETNYADKLLSCYSVLATRVQMGTVYSFDNSSTLVGAGYACLAKFRQQDIYTPYPVASVTFMTDPVCATLAMRLMDEEWSEGNLVGCDKKFWTEQAEKAFSYRICDPIRGHAGNVFAALYMLFCGDLLRKKNGVSNGRGLYSNFVVSLDEWFSLLMNGGKEQSRDDETQGDGQKGPNVEAVRHVGGTTSTISFVHLCRNELLSFCKARYLEYMYQSGLGSYTFRECEAVDISASIRVVEKDSDEARYHPLLVSVKDWCKVTEDNVVEWESYTKLLLEELRNDDSGIPSAVCLLIVLGCSNPPKMKGDHERMNLASFPANDVYRLVVLDKDEFGIAQAIYKMRDESECRGMYLAHHSLQNASSSSEFLSPSSIRGEDAEDLVQALKGVS